MDGEDDRQQHAQAVQFDIQDGAHLGFLAADARQVAVEEVYDARERVKDGRQPGDEAGRAQRAPGRGEEAAHVEKQKTTDKGEPGAVTEGGQERAFVVTVIVGQGNPENSELDEHDKPCGEEPMQRRWIGRHTVEPKVGGG